MKKELIFSGVFFCLLAAFAACGNKDDIRGERKFYYAFDEKIFLDEVKDKVALSFDENNLSDIQDLLQKDGRIQHMELFAHNDYYILTMKKPNIKALREEFSKQAGIRSVNPLYRLNDAEMVITDEIVVQFKDGVSQQKINEIHEKFKVEVLKTTELHHLLSVPIEFDPLEVANRYQESGLTNFSHPNFYAAVSLY